MTNRTTSSEILSVATAMMLLLAATLTALVSPVAARSVQFTTRGGPGDGGHDGGGPGDGEGPGSTGSSISIPTNTTQQSDCETGGASSAISASCNNNSTNTIDNSGGILQQ
jgi:hypothetical protein